MFPRGNIFTSDIYSISHNLFIQISSKKFQSPFVSPHLAWLDLAWRSAFIFGALENLKRLFEGLSEPFRPSAAAASLVSRLAKLLLHFQLSDDRWASATGTSAAATAGLGADAVAGTECQRDLRTAADHRGSQPLQDPAGQQGLVRCHGLRFRRARGQLGQHAARAAHVPGDS